MPSGFFTAKSIPSRFEMTEAFKQPVSILNKLRDKQNELKEAADVKGNGSIDFEKHHIIAKLMQQIDKAISEFNESKFTSLSDETTQMIKTTRKLLEIISNVPKAEEKTLKTSRNNQRENMSNAVYYGTFFTTFITGSALSAGTLGAIASLLYIAPTVSKSVHESTGLNDLSPTSARLLHELTIILKKIYASLIRQCYGDIQIKESEAEDFICPITQEIIHDPVVCTLDGHAYERNAIEEWFKHNTRSPLNRNEIPPGKSVQDVLITHFNYASLLEKYRREHSVTINTSACL